MSINPQRKKLPINPSLEHLQKQAKRRVKQTPGLALAAAQHQLAREYGCKSWAELARMVETMSRRQDLIDDHDKRYEAMAKAARYGEFEKMRALHAAGDFTQHTLDQSLAHVLQYGEESNWPARKAAADFLVENGADPDGQYGSGGYGPIVFGSAECLQPNGIEYLIAAGADVTAAPVETKYGSQCVVSHVLAAYSRGENARKHRCLDLLLTAGAYVPPEVTPPILAIHRGDVAQLSTLLDGDPALVNRRFADMPYGNTALRGATLLHCAAEFGEADCMAELVKRGADLNATADVIDGVGGQTVIFHAMGCAVDGESSCLKGLLLPINFGLRDPKVAASIEPGSMRFNRIDFSICAVLRRFGERTQPTTPMRFVSDAIRDAGPRRREGAAAVQKMLREAVPLAMFTPPAQDALRLAFKGGSFRVDSDHLLLALTSLSKGSVVPLLAQLGTTLEALRAALEREMPPPEHCELKLGAPWPVTDRYKRLFKFAANEAMQGGHVKIGTGHILLAMTNENDGAAANALRSVGLTSERVRAALSDMEA